METMTKLDCHYGYISRSFPSIHIAGTNGKGSVATKIACGLKLSGKKTALFTSPHIATFRERIKINQKMISEEEVVTILEELFLEAEKLSLMPTFFEYVTLLAFKWFSDQKIDYAVVEVGLGGRLDATNILLPELAIITSISLDHTSVLGETLEQIAYEKGGIIKEKVPVILGPKTAPILRTIAEERNSKVMGVEGCFSTYDEENNAISKEALAFLSVEEKLIERAITIRPSCRYEVAAPTLKRWPQAVIFDVAHNPAAFTALMEQLRNDFPKNELWLIFAISQDKDIKSCCAIINRYASKVWCLQADPHRGENGEELRKQLIDAGVAEENCYEVPSAKEAVSQIWTAPAIDKAILCVCGSFFHMADVKEALNQAQQKDTYRFNEKVTNFKETLNGNIPG